MVEKKIDVIKVLERTLIGELEWECYSYGKFNFSMVSDHNITEKKKIRFFLHFYARGTTITSTYINDKKNEFLNSVYSGQPGYEELHTLREYLEQEYEEGRIKKFVQT